MIEIAHVSESLGGGVLTSIVNLVQLQLKQKCKISIHFVRRQDTPKFQDLKLIFGDEIDLYEYGRSNFKNTIQMIRKINRSFNNSHLHLHSSKAGFFGRILLNSEKNYLYYSPHSFAFTRQDIKLFQQTVYKLLEKFADVFSNTTSVCVSRHEQSLAEKLHFRSVKLLLNSIDDPMRKYGLSEIDFANRIWDVCNVARLAPQKNPSRFFNIAKNLGQFKFVWVGGGSVNEQPPSNLFITGWISGEQAMSYLNKSRIFCSTSDWEGLSISIIESQMLGIPSVVMDIPSNREVVINGKTGYLCTTEEELELRIFKLLSDRNIWYTMSKNARDLSLKKFESQMNSHNWTEIYDIKY